MNYGAKTFLAERLEARRARRIALVAVRLPTEPVLGTFPPIDLDRLPEVPAAVHFSRLARGDAP